MSRIEFLTEHFYAWEKRCRGWEVYSFPVDLEPPFLPFFFHAVPSNISMSVIDDGVRPSLFSSFTNAIKNAFAPKSTISEEPFDDGPLPPFEFTNDEKLVALTLSLPKDQKIKVEEIQHLLLMLSLSLYPISFEIIGNSNKIWIQFVCRESDAPNVQNQINAYYPLSHLEVGNLDDIFSEGKNGFIIDFGLKEEFMRPLTTPKNFDLDPYVGLFGILENLKKDEHAAIQILFKGALNAWSESIIRSVTDNNGDSFFLDAPEMVKLAEEKISAPFFGVVIRIIGLNDTGDISLTKRL